MKAVVLAAGQGTRMKPLTKDKPKALVELKGKELLGHVLESLERAGAREAIVVVGFKGSMVRKMFGKKLGKMRLSYVMQRIPMGTAHAVLKAKGKTGKRFLVAYADVIVQASLWKKLWSVHRFDAVAALRREKNVKRFGVALVDGKRLQQIAEKPRGRIESNLVNVGAYCFTDRIFPVLRKVKMSTRGEFELTDAVNAIAAKGRAGFVLYAGKCLDIGTLKDLRAAEKG